MISRVLDRSFAILLCWCISSAALTTGCARSLPGETYDAGYVLAESQRIVRHDFLVKNTTSRDVKVLRVEKTCGCASYNLGKDRLTPGEVTTLRMEVSVLRSYMVKHAACILKTDHPLAKEWVYTINLVSVPHLVSDPPDMDLGQFAIDGKNVDVVREATLDFFQDSKIESLSLADFLVPDELELVIQRSPQFKEYPGGVWRSRYRVSLRMSSSGKEGVMRNAVSGLTTRAVRIRPGGAGGWSTKYAVYWRVRPPIECHPSYLNLGSVPGGATRSVKVEVASTLNQTFHVDSVESDRADVRVELANKGVRDKPRQMLEIRVQPFPKPHADNPAGRARRFASGRIVIHHGTARMGRIEVPWSAGLDLGREPIIQPPVAAPVKQTSS